MITEQEIKDIIKEEIYFTSRERFGLDGQVMICVLKTTSGYECVGHAGTITPRDNWDENKAMEIAYKRAFDDLWAKEAYHRQRIK